jgi:hypothetical protein
VLSKKIEKTAQALERSAILLSYRRLNWKVETRYRVLEQFRLFIEMAEDKNLPFRFGVPTTDPNNEEVIELKSGSAPLGIIEKKQALFSQEMSITSLIETGGSLCVSQSATGEVILIAYPRSSDRISPIKKEIILFRPKDPTDVTDKLIKKAICDYLLILQHSTYFGSSTSMTSFEKFQIFWIYIRDIRTTHSTIRSIIYLKNSWAQAFIGALFGLIFGVLFS